MHSITSLSDAYLAQSPRDSMLFFRILSLNFLPNIGICPGCTTTIPGSNVEAMSIEFFISNTLDLLIASLYEAILTSDNGEWIDILIL